MVNEIASLANCQLLSIVHPSFRRIAGTAPDETEAWMPLFRRSGVRETGRNSRTRQFSNNIYGVRWARTFGIGPNQRRRQRPDRRQESFESELATGERLI